MTTKKNTRNRVLVFGTFDILHPGHLYFLREAKKHGDHLTVVVTPASVVKKLKGKAPMFGEAHRVAAVRLMSFVDTVIIGDKKLSSFAVLKKHAPDVICIGYDQKELEKYLKEYCKRTGTAIPLLRLKAYNPKTYTSGRLKKILSGKEVCLRCRI